MPHGAPRPPFFSAVLHSLHPRAPLTHSAPTLTHALPLQAADALATAQVVVCIARLCWEARDLAQLNAQVLALSKKRGQLKQAITELVQLAITFLPQVSARADKEELVLTLKAVVDGKIYVEVERARIVVELAAMREAEGRVAEASEALQEVAVETFGSMDKAEKVEILLEQVRVARRAPPPHTSSPPLPNERHAAARARPSPPLNLRPPSPPRRCASPSRSATFPACPSSPTR